MTYNILSERYTFRDGAFEYCPDQFLINDYRKHLVIKEIIGYKADIVCLQEMDESVFRAFYNQKFRQAGYHYVFNRKGNKSSEGLAFLHNTKKFEYASSFKCTKPKI